MEEPKPRLTNYETEEKAAEAEGLLASPVLQGALADVYSRALGILIADEVGSLTAGHAHAMLKAITELKAQLEQYVDDHKVRQKYNKGDK
jgi:hypothetical protein